MVVRIIELLLICQDRMITFNDVSRVKQSDSHYEIGYKFPPDASWSLRCPFICKYWELSTYMHALRPHIAVSPPCIASSATPSFQAL